MRLTSTNPARNYESVGSVEISTDIEITAKVAKAQAAKTAWKELGVAARIKLLEPIRDEFVARRDEFVDLIVRETGKAIGDARAEMERYTDHELNWFLENGERALANETTVKDEESYHRIVFEPYGVAAVISPWNFPFGMAAWGIFPNLIAGNPVVFKTSEECPLTGKLMEEIILNHNLPEGVFAEVYGAGSVGQKLAESDINLIWFTGSTRTGKLLYKIAADKFIKAVLEMGGSNPCVVFGDVDIAQAAPVIFNGRFRNNGQFCSALKRLIVHEGIADELIAALRKIIEEQKVGDPFDPQTDHGSLVAKRQVDLLQEQYNDALAKGAKVAARAELPEGLKGAFFPPTLLTGITKNMRVWHEEVFGPVFPVVTFKTEEEAIELANDTRYGLGARVMSGDTDRAIRVASKIDAGSILLNLETRLTAANPFGGYKDSGLGRERSIHGLQELCQLKAIQDHNTPFYGEN
ncbi:MAG TPA: aldehyde dehydrogenase family protein [Candidatus Saccharimonadales bacterium]|nr:aldehyde dehydrogenase family protein [Candidatus Saccharimonadales bacterium]